MRYVLLALGLAGVLAVACGGGGDDVPEGGASGPLLDAVTAVAATQETEDAKDIASIGDSRELAFFPDRDFESDPEKMRVTVLALSIESLSPVGESDPQPTLVLQVLIENPTDGTGSRPKFVVVTPSGKSFDKTYIGWEYPKDLVSIKELPPRTQLEGAFFIPLEAEGVEPPTSLAGWRVVVTTGGLVPRENARAVWQVE